MGPSAALRHLRRKREYLVDVVLPRREAAAGPGWFLTSHYHSLQAEVASLEVAIACLEREVSGRRASVDGMTWNINASGKREDVIMLVKEHTPPPNLAGGQPEEGLYTIAKEHILDVLAASPAENATVDAAGHTTTTDGKLIASSESIKVTTF